MGINKKNAGIEKNNESGHLYGDSDEGELMIKLFLGKRIDLMIYIFMHT